MSKKQTVPPKKNPHGRFRGATLVFSPDRDDHGRPVPRSIDAATGKARWKWVLRRPHPDDPEKSQAKNLYCTDWRDAESEARKQLQAWATAAPAEKASAGHQGPAATEPWHVSDLTARWLDSTDQRDAGWVRLAVTPFFVTKLGNPLVRDVTEAACKAWEAEYGKGDTAVSQSTQHQRYRVLRALFRYAVAKGQRTDLPFEPSKFKVTPKLYIDGGDQRSHHPLTTAELTAIVQWLTEHATPAVTFAVQLAAAIGLRDQEVTHLRLADVLLDAPVPYIHVAHFPCGCMYCKKHRGGQRKTKGRRERKVPLPPELVGPFRDYLKGRAEQVPASSKWTFPVWSASRSRKLRPGDQLGCSTFNDWLQKAIAPAEITVDPERHRLVFHSLRAMANTDLDARSNGNATAVMVALGHKPATGVKDRYDQLRDRLDLLAAKLYPDHYTDDLAKKRQARAVKKTA
jgi:integrase